MAQTKLVRFSPVSKTQFGDSSNYSQFIEDGKLHFYGDARPVILDVVHGNVIETTSAPPLGFTALAAANGITTSGLTTPPDAGRHIEVIGFDGGINAKGTLSDTYTRKNTTDAADQIKIRLTTMFAINTWVQATGWKLILEIATGDIAGTFTIFMPAFDLLEYSTIELYVTIEGATYASSNGAFGRSLSGPEAATETITSNISSGSDIVIPVASTTGFYEGNEALISDSADSEWARITTIISNTSITVNELANAYTTANGAKIDILDYIGTPLKTVLRRGLYTSHLFTEGENLGIHMIVVKPQSADNTEDLYIQMQYMSTEDNAGGDVTKWRIQYVLTPVGEYIPETLQPGELIYTDVVPPATKTTAYTTVGIIPAEEHDGKYMLGLEFVRLGKDSGDTYAGDIHFLCSILPIKHKQLGYES